MEIDCGRFLLRGLQMSDKESMAKYANNYNVWLNVRDYFPHPYSIKDAVAFIEHCMQQQPPYNLCVDYDNECIGMVGFVPQKDVYRKTADFGYWLGEPFWGKGIMTKAVQKTTRYIFENFDIVRIFAGVFEWNKASMRVLEKAGFTHDCIFKKGIFKNGRIIDEYRYSLLRE